MPAITFIIDYYGYWPASQKLPSNVTEWLSKHALYAEFAEVEQPWNFNTGYKIKYVVKDIQEGDEVAFRLTFPDFTVKRRRLDDDDG
jgi:hypothetical protein